MLRNAKKKEKRKVEKEKKISAAQSTDIDSEIKSSSSSQSIRELLTASNEEKLEVETNLETSISATNEIVSKLILALHQVKENTGTDIVIAAVLYKDKLVILKSYFSNQNVTHPLNTPIANLMLSACQDGYDSKLFIVSTHKPTKFESEAIKIMGINKLGYQDSESEFILLERKNRKKVNEKKLTFDQKHFSEIEFFQEIKTQIEKPEIKAQEVAKLRTQDSFLWCEDLEPLNLDDCGETLQKELYMGLLYSALFILWNESARPHTHKGRAPIAAMLIDDSNKPVAFSINTSEADNSIAHAETGMLLRHLGNNNISQLPNNSKLYTTLESCEMCRSGLYLAKGKDHQFYETYGQKDKKVGCEVYENYSLSSHEATSNYLKDINIRTNNEDFYKFCRGNYLALNTFLQDKILITRFPALFSNIQMIWDQLLQMRILPWVGNPLLYNLQDDPIDTQLCRITEKENFEKIFVSYYGSDISQFRLKANTVEFNGEVKVNGEVRIGQFIDVAPEAQNCTIKNGKLISDQPIYLSISKQKLKEQSGIQMGLKIDGSRVIGNYQASEEDNKLKKILFKETMNCLKKLSHQPAQGDSNTMNRVNDEMKEGEFISSFDFSSAKFQSAKSDVFPTITSGTANFFTEKHQVEHKQRNAPNLLNTDESPSSSISCNSSN